MLLYSRVQLNKISDKISSYFEDKKYREPFSSSENAFRFIADNTDKKEKTVVAIDEFPYLVEGNKSIPSILQSVWDNHLKNKKIMFIISGSSIGFMEREILSEKNPLYGRATGIFKVKEMDFNSARGFMPESNMIEAIKYYSIFSGVPYYLSQIDSDRDIGENITRSILKNGAILFNEAEFLLKQELRDVYNYNSIIEAIALGNTKLNDIYTKSEIDKNKLPYYINNLIDLNIIDFADNWQHYIAVESYIDDYDKNYPVCIEGEGNTPPEDVGGKYGYEEFLEAIEDESHSEYDNMIAWGKSQGYKEFDIKDTNKEVQFKYRLS